MKQIVLQMRYILLLSLVVLPLLQSFGQTLRAYEKAGDQALKDQDFYNAVYYYEQVLKSKQRIRVYYKYGGACRQSFAYQKAEAAYKKVLDSKQANYYPKAHYYYAAALKHNGKYEEAEQAFEDYLKIAQDSTLLAKAQQEKASCVLARELAENPIDSVKINRLGDNINTEYSDFGAHEFGEEGQLYYSSLKFDRKATKEEKTTGQKRMISKLMQAEDTTAKGKIISGLNNPSEHNANSCLSTDGQILFFSRCNADRADSMICNIYKSVWQEEKARWSKPQKLNAPLNLEGYSSTQPSIATDTLGTWLYFVSNRPGGAGQFDIWRVPLQGDSISGPAEALPAPINTQEDEATPFYHQKTNRLYFSSQWHQGMGGYDIFYSEQKDGVWTSPKNLGVPFNSAANDLYWVLNRNDTTGYFASNRKGSMTITEESCCNDIYAFNWPNLVPQQDTPFVTETTIDTNLITQVDNPPHKTEEPPSIDQKIEELNEMLPLKLYFHNDEPDSNVTVQTTDIPYNLTYDFYLTLKDKYMEEHSAQFDVEKQPLVKAKVRQFFEIEVEGEFNRKNAFYDAIIELLELGVKLEVQIKGYTSPRSYEGYNVALAHRRITSVRKEFFVYRKGIFLQYFQQGLLTVSELPLGESTSPEGIPDAFDDPQNSIYSVEASKERRAEIVVLIKK
jgi:hypothetical protein